MVNHVVIELLRKYFFEIMIAQKNKVNALFRQMKLKNTLFCQTKLENTLFCQTKLCKVSRHTLFCQKKSSEHQDFNYDLLLISQLLLVITL